MRENIYMKKKIYPQKVGWYPITWTTKAFHFSAEGSSSCVCLLTCKRGPDKMDVLLDLFNVLNFL